MAQAFLFCSAVLFDFFVFHTLNPLETFKLENLLITCCLFVGQTSQFYR